MSPFLFSADAAVANNFVTRSEMTVEQQIVTSFQRALADRDYAQMRFLRESARALDPVLVAELDGFDYPAAA